AIQSAPAIMPILVIDVTSKNTVWLSACKLPAWLQKALPLGSNTPIDVAILAAHSPKPYTTPQGWPDTIKLATASNARPMPATTRRLSHKPALALPDCKPVRL